MTSVPDNSQPSLNRRLIDAAVAGDLALVRRLLDAGAETHVTRADSEEAVLRQNNRPAAQDDVFAMIGLHTGQNRLNAAMYLAAFHGFDNIVEHFLDRAAHDPMTLKVALFGAARAGKKELVEKLVAAGAEADFKKDYPLRQSIRHGHEETAVFLATQTGADDRAVGYAVTAGNIGMAAAFLKDTTNIAVVMDGIAHALGMATMPPSGAKRQRDEPAILAGFHMVLGFAAARGDDMQGVLMMAATAAVKHESLPLINDIRWLEELQDIPDKTAVLTALLLPKTPFGNTPAVYSEAMVRLIDDGADPYKGLMIGVQQSDVPIVEAALRQRVDPRRRHDRAVIAARVMADKAVTNAAPAMQILGDLLAVEAVHMVMDETVYRDGLAADDALKVWRDVDAGTGKSGLMSVFAIGQAEKYFELLEKAGELPRLDDVLHQDKTGYRALDCLDDAGQLGLLFAPAFWQSRQDDYQKLWQALTPAQQESQQAAHEALSRRWATASGHARVSRLAQQNKGRFKL